MTLTRGFQCKDGVCLQENERREIGIVTTLGVVVNRSENSSSKWRGKSECIELIGFLKWRRQCTDENVSVGRKHFLQIEV